MFSVIRYGRRVSHCGRGFHNVGVLVFQTWTTSNAYYATRFLMTGELDISNTSLSGDLCTDIVEVDLGWWSADCLGNPPAISCPCCSECCQSGTLICDEIVDIPLDVLCKRLAKNFEGDGHTRCECGSDSLSMSCHYIDQCATCNQDGTVCGFMESFEYTLEARDGDLYGNYFNGTFQYDDQADNGRANVIIDMDLKYSGKIPTVAVNGQECARTTWVQCVDDYYGYEIDCTNVVLWDDNDKADGRLPQTYDPCTSKIGGDGGIFDVFAWRDWDVYSGCPPLPY